MSASAPSDSPTESGPGSGDEKHLRDARLGRPLERLGSGGERQPIIDEIAHFEVASFQRRQGVLERSAPGAEKPNLIYDNG